MSSNEYLSSKNRLFECLQKLDHHFSDFSGNTRNYRRVKKSVKWLIREFQFLDIFVSLQRFTDEPDMEQVTQKIQTLFQEAAIDFSEFLNRITEIEGFYARDQFEYEPCNSKVRNLIRSTKMDIKAKYSFPKMSLLPVSANLVRDFIYAVVENLPTLFYDPFYVPETADCFQHVLKELKFLQTFVCFVSERLIEPQSQHCVNFLAHALAVAGHASVLSWLYLPNLTPGEINASLSHLLQMRIKPIQPCIRKIYVDVLQELKSTIQSGYKPVFTSLSCPIEANFVEIILHNLGGLPLYSKSSPRLALKDPLAVLHEMINFLEHSIMPIQDLDPLRPVIDTIIIDVGLLVYSLYEDKEEMFRQKKKGKPEKVNLAPVVDSIKSFCQDLHLTIQKAFQSNLPRIHGLGYVDFLVSNLKEFQSCYSDSHASVASQLQIIQKELESFQPFLVDVAEERYSGRNKVQCCVAQLIGKAYMVEYIIDAFITKETPRWCLERWLLNIIEEIPLIRAEVTEIQKNEMAGYALNTVSSHMSSNLTRLPRMNDEFVGFEDVITKLRHQLIKGTRELDVISICGMPGLGKTTLAYKLYYDSSLVSYFDIRAQCCVSQVYSRKDLLLALLRDATGENSQNKTKEVDEIADELRKALFFKRYLILVDDIWDASAWDDLVGCFQDANNGSRIIITTRNHEVANYARCQSDPLQLRMFNDDESWELLRKKVFGEEICVPSLTKTGRQIAKGCGQLPISVALVAGILVGIEKKEECWQEVANNLGTYIYNDSRAIIEHSYQNLPYHLKSCFLYFGICKEDNLINVSKLIRLWISEGFIKSYHGKSLEDIAEVYLENLLGRNLVTGARKSYGGKMEACHIHDLLHDFCKEKAMEENFLQQVTWYRNSKSSLRYICGLGYSMPQTSSFWPHVGSIISDSFSIDFSEMFHGFKHLKVLDLERNCIGSFPTDLFYLRYFSAAALRSRIPSSLPYTNCNLETLILHSYPEKELPITLCEMVKLRHLHINTCRFSFTRQNEEELLDISKSLHDLKTLSCPSFSCVRDLELILRKTPDLRELRCKLKGLLNYQHYVMEFSTQVQTLEFSAPFR